MPQIRPQTIENLHQSVNKKDILISLMDRISNYAQSSHATLPADVNGFQIFADHVRASSTEIS
eukprot:SAG11_NODE_3988_length_2120_cov_1.427511_2_plen_63_part_00